MAFPADNRTFSLTLAVSADDPYRGRLRDPGIFDRFLAAVPMTRPWVEVGEPITDVSLMAGIDNRWRRLTDAAGRPAVGGLVLVGDASLHTNPTFGRGVSLALAQAQRLADTVEQVDDDRVAFVAGFEAWTAAHLGVWYESQVAADRGGLERLAAGLRGEHLPSSDDPISRFIAGLFALAPTDPAVARALARVGHLLLTPSDLFADAEVVNKVGAYLDAHPVIDPPVPGPTRAQFVDLVKA
jgi:2-polyprenyl-6-methoxyphenol hydroxylase-like FAD-dependent oxidoreductase